MTRRDRLAPGTAPGRALAVMLGFAPMLAPVLVLAGCESQARQDPIYVRNSSDTLVFKDTAFFRDRPIDESLRGSLELADYTTALDRTGLLVLLQRPGPYTVFAIPNPSMEQAQSVRSGHLMDPAMLPSLRRTLSYTIVPGAYSEQAMRGMLAKARGPVGLRTLDGDLLTVSIEPSTNQLLLSDPSGRSNRIWMSSMPQANGRLYVTQSMLSPG
jgi:uncharacterized surface protein with fasciclin (FAS1) repeats